MATDLNGRFQVLDEALFNDIGASNVTRQLAIWNNFNKYTGSACYKCGHSLRYTKTSNCVNCLRYKPTGRPRSEILPERQKAIDNNEEFYFTGKSCKHGHISKRYTVGSRCYECTLTIFKVRRQGKERQYSLAKYGLTPDQYDAMFLAQSGLCAICKNPEVNIDHNTKTIRALAVDHCHDTERVRKLLCSNCNMGIGLFKHSSNLLKMAAVYCEEA